MVNLYGRGGLLAALELDGLTGVRVCKRAGNDGARVGLDLETNIGQVAAQNVVAGVALVAVNVVPGGAELIAGVTGLGSPILHLQRGQLALRGGQIRRERGGGINCLVRVLDLGERLGCYVGVIVVGSGGRRLRTEEAALAVFAHVNHADNQQNDGQKGQQAVDEALLLRVHGLGEPG